MMDQPENKEYTPLKRKMQPLEYRLDDITACRLFHYYFLRDDPDPKCQRLAAQYKGTEAAMENKFRNDWKALRGIQWNELDSILLVCNLASH